MDLFLGIKAAVGGWFARLLKFPLSPIFIIMIHPPGADLRQFGQALDFDAPALIIAQMPVKAVHFQASEMIQIALYLIDGMEMAADI